MASIKDVALLANVSVTTVSHVVNKTRFVSLESCARVEDAIRALGYVPSAVARSLKSKTTRTLGMLIPNSSNPYFAQLVHSVEEHCFGAGYNLILCNTSDEPNRQSTYLQVLAERRVDGLIVVSTGEDNSLATQLQGLTVPTVLVDREIAGLRCDLVETANVDGGLMATRHLLELGHQRIACIGGARGLVVSEQRIKGWRHAMQTAGLRDLAPELLLYGDFTSQGGYLATQAMLKLDPRPTAIFVCNDLMAIGALRAAHEASLWIPDALSIVGFDDIELASFTSPPLSTVAQPTRRIGMLAVDLLLELISGRRHEPRQVLFQPELRVRKSSGVCPT
jgi:LacI family transcriptional regulator